MASLLFAVSSVRDALDGALGVPPGMHSAGLRCSKVNGNPRIRPFGQRRFSLGGFRMNILCSDCTRTSAALAMRRIIPGAVGGMLQVHQRANPCSPGQRAERVSAFRARVSLSGSMPGRPAGRDVDAVTYAFVARARPAWAGRPGSAVQSPGRPRWRRPGHGHRPQHIRDPRRLKHAWVRRNLGYSEITTSRPSSPTASGPFPDILPLSVILGSRIASTKGGLHSGVTHVTVCANDGHASAAAAADRIIFRNAHQCVAHDSSVTPSSFANYGTRNARPVPASTHAPAGTAILAPSAPQPRTSTFLPSSHCAGRPESRRVTICRRASST